MRVIPHVNFSVRPALAAVAPSGGVIPESPPIKIVTFNLMETMATNFSKRFFYECDECKYAGLESFEPNAQEIPEEVLVCMRVHVELYHTP